jgi:vitamin B12 transporter
VQREFIVVILFRSAVAAAAGLVAGTFGVFSAAPAFAQAAASGTEAQSVVVTATRQPTRVDAQLSDVTVLDREDIERAEGQTLVELLGQQPGIQFISNGGLGQSSGVSIRGTDVRHTLLLIDGVRYGSATLGQAVFDNIPLEDIERIEIVRGPLSSLYGADAAGGVIQVFTKRGRTGLHANASAGAGSDGYRTASAGLNGATGGWSGALQLQHQQTRGFSATNANAGSSTYNPDDDGFRQNSATASLGYAFSPDWQFDAHALSAKARVHYDDGPGADAQADLTTQTADAALSGRLGPAWRSTLRLARSVDAYDTLASASPFTDLGTIRTQQDQLSWENHVDTPIGSLLALAEHLKQTVHKPNGDYDNTERSIDGAALGLDGRSGPHSWQASVRHDRNTQFGSQNTGNLAYGYDLTAQWRLSAALGSSFVAPSFNLLYWPGFGNPNLLPERGHSKEATLRWRLDDTQALSLTGYSNRVRDYITAANTNVGYALLDGATLAYDGLVADWQLNASLDQLNARDSDGNPLPRRARHSAKLSADRRIGTWSAGASLLAESSRPDTHFDDSFNAIPVTMGGFTRVDLRGDWQFAPEWTLQLRLNNVADHHYETAYGYNQPGREWFATLRWAPR